MDTQEMKQSSAT